MKKIILFGIIALLAMFAYALSYGDILTQGQVDAIDTDNLNLNSAWTDLGVDGFVVQNGMILRQFEHDYFKKNWTDNTYEYIKATNSMKVAPFTDWQKCRARNSKADCLQGFKILSDIKLYDGEIAIKNSIKNVQTKAVESLD